MYGVNELLKEEDVAELTAETFGAKSKPRRVWRRVAALVACAMLVVGAANFGAIAAGVQRVWQYFAGAGAVNEGAAVLVQKGTAAVSDGDRAYVVTGAYSKDGVLAVALRIFTEAAEGEELALHAALSRGEKQYPAFMRVAGRGVEELWEYDGIRTYSQSDFSSTEGVLSPSDSLTPYYEDYAGCTGGFLWFQIDEGAGAYDLVLTDTARGTTVKLPLELAEAEELEYKESLWETEALSVTALVVPDGSRVLLLGEMKQDMRREFSWLVSFWGSGVTFVDEYGNRVSATSGNSGIVEGKSIELVPSAPLPGEITAIEIKSLNYSYTHALAYPDRRLDENGKIAFWHFSSINAQETDLNWRIELK